MRYREAGFAANKFVRRSISYDGPDGVRGGVKGSFPIEGDYGRFEYLNWAAKFFIDSNQAEADLRPETTASRWRAQSDGQSEITHHKDGPARSAVRSATRASPGQLAGASCFSPSARSSMPRP